MEDYHDSYLKCDVLLLVNVFIKFRKSSFKNYGLCPSHYFSAPVLSWYLKLILNLISGAHKYLFFEKYMSGGVSYISKRYRKFNNKYLKSYDPKQESKHIYLDVNNLYGYTMPKFPTNGFKWIVPKECDLNRYAGNDPKQSRHIHRRE